MINRRRLAVVLVGVVATVALTGFAPGSVSAATSAFAGSKGSSVQTASVVMPNVVGFRMDQATRTLHNRGLRVNEECSGLFGCIAKSNWWVCVQSPRAGKRVAKYSVVMIYAERRGDC